MKKFFILMLLCVNVLAISAQELKINDVEMMNLGDGRLFAREKKGEKPINGRVRIITGYTTEYIDAGFDKGYANGKWEYYKQNGKKTKEETYEDGQRTNTQSF